MSDQVETTAGSTQLPGWGGVLGAALIGGVLAAVINGVLWAIAGQDIQVPNQGNADDMIDLALPMVIFASIVPAILAGVTAKLIVRSAARAGRVLVIVGVVGFPLSMGGPLSIQDAPGGDIATLTAMHFVATVAILGSIARRYRAA